MITTPPRWTLLPRLDGVTIVAPEGPAAGVVRYHERLRPLLSASHLLAERLRVHATFTPDAPPRLEQLTTYEGEHAAFATVAGTAEGRRVQYALGLVFGDDFYARVEGFSESPAHLDHFAAAVREATLSDRHFLGERRRRFVYASNGWTPIGRGFNTDWVAPKFPRTWGMITVYPALPVSATGATIATLVQRAQLQHGSSTRAVPITTTSGLAGELVTVRMPAPDEKLFSIAAVADARYLYTAELTSRTEADYDAHEEAFARLWQSIQPIPKPTGRASSHSWPLPVE